MRTPTESKVGYWIEIFFDLVVLSFIIAGILKGYQFAILGLLIVGVDLFNIIVRGKRGFVSIIVLSILY